MDQKYFDDLLDKYGRGECSPEEEKLIDKLYDQLSVTDRDLLKEDPKFALSAERRLHSALHRHTHRPAAIRIFSKRYLFRAAAASLTGLLILSTILYFSRHTRSPSSIAQTSIHTGANQRKEITLPDGSEVWLNQLSTLTWSDNRLVQLTGEARFRIASDASKAFIVETGPASTKVLGTKFNIEAYADEKEIKVSLLSGKVQFGDSTTAFATLLPGHMATYNKQDHGWPSPIPTTSGLP